MDRSIGAQRRREIEALRARVAELERSRAAGLNALTRMNRFISLSLEMSEVLREIARAAAALTGAPVVSFWITDEGTRTLECGAFSDEAVGATYPARTLGFDQSLMGWVATHRRPLDVPDVFADDRPAAPEWWQRHGLKSFYGLPVLLDESLVAVLALNGRVPFRLGPDEHDLLGSFVLQAAVAIRNARLYARSEARRREAEALAEVARGLAQSLNPDEVGQQIADSVRLLLRAQAAVLYRLLPESGALVALAASGNAAPSFGRKLVLPKGFGAAGLAVSEGQPVVTSDLWSDARIRLTSALQRSPHRAVLAVPLLFKDTVIGAMAVGDPAGRVFNAEEVRLAEAFADHAVVTLENARLFEENQRKVEELAVLHELSKDVTGQLDTAQLLHALGEQVGRVVDAQHVVIVLYDEERREFEIASTLEDGKREPASSVRYPVERGLVGRVLERRQAVRTSDYSETCQQEGVEPSASSRQFRHWLGVPMVAGDHVVGALVVSSAVCAFTEANEQLLGNIANLAALAVRSARLYEERTRTYEQLAQTQHQLVHAQKMDAVGRLAGGIAHDFNNLLTVISGRSALLLAIMPPDDATRRHVDLIVRTADSAASLTRQLLAFSRKQVLRPKVLDLNAVVGDLAAMLRRLIGEHIELLFAPGSATGRVRVDRAQIEQTVMNLVVNARDAMPTGGRLTLQTQDVELDEAFVRSHGGASCGPHVMLVVSDTGIGMDRETCSHIFEPFFTTKELGKGTGLGLSTVYGVVEQHDGYISVESEHGRGTTFRIYLRRVDDPADVAEVGTVVTTLGRGSETILLVEDDHGVRDLAREVLQARGYHVMEARHPGEALLLAERWAGPIHLTVTDVVMPEMSGRELVARLLATRPEMKVLFMSGYTDDALGSHGALDPSIVLLQKPFVLDGLVRTVREVLDEACASVACES